MSHNKKRNTAFLFEALSIEGTKAILEKDINRANFVKTMILDFFGPKTELSKELNLYKALDKGSVESEIADKYLQEVKSRYDKLDKKKIFNEQSTLINVINKYLGGKVYNNFVPSYKNLATITQLFNDATPIKEKILLERSVLQQISKLNEKVNELKPVDNILYNTFTKKFNEKYSELLSEQKDLLTKFVGSFADDGLDLKIYLNEEIERLKEGLEIALKSEEIKDDESMRQKTQNVKDFLKSFRDAKEITHDMLEKILKIQQFVHEVNH
jgi:hypothetical protein